MRRGCSVIRDRAVADIDRSVAVVVHATSDVALIASIVEVVRDSTVGEVERAVAIVVDSGALVREGAVHHRRVRHIEGSGAVVVDSRAPGSRCPDIPDNNVVYVKNAVKVIEDAGTAGDGRRDVFDD